MRASLQSEEPVMEGNLFSMCVSSFTAVFVVLAFLAVAMRILIVVFPEKKVAIATDDAPIFAAISSIYAQRYPGARVTKIEEIK